MNQLEAMRIYLRVADLRSFTQAADSLNLPKATVSEAIKQLEAQLGTRLLQRTTRSVQMTQDGMLYYERSKDLLHDFAELTSLFDSQQTPLHGRLRVDLPVAAARNIVIPALPEFLALHPGIEIELSCTDRRVDLIREGFDCVMRVGTLHDSSLIARPLGYLGQVNLASKAYLEQWGTPRELDDLQAHFLIHYVSNFGNKSLGFEYQQAGKTHYLAMKGGMTVNNSDAYHAACQAGFGIIQVPQFGQLHAASLQNLVSILPDYQAPSMPVSILYPDRRHLAKRTQKFIEWLSDKLKPHLLPA
jgi:DNA-binding transcriptional LysR family regulator